MGEGGDLRGQHLPVNIAGLCFFSEHNRYAEMLCSDTCNANTRCLNGQNLGHTLVTETPEKLLAKLVDECHVHLMIQKGIDLEDITVFDASALQNGVFQ